TVDHLHQLIKPQMLTGNPEIDKRRFRSGNASFAHDLVRDHITHERRVSKALIQHQLLHAHEFLILIAIHVDFKAVAFGVGDKHQRSLSFYAEAHIVDHATVE